MGSALCALMLALTPRPCLAVEGPTAETRAEAKRAYTEAKRLQKQGKDAEALAQFQRAHDLVPTPVTRLDLARALASAGRLVEAHALASTVGDLPTTQTETQKSKVARDDAKAFAIELAARRPKITFSIVPSSTAPEVAVDGKPVSKELLTGELPLDPGDHKVTARANDQTVEVDVSLRESESKQVELKLSPPAPVVEPKPAQPIDASAPQKGEAPGPRAPAAPKPAPKDDGITPVVPVAFATSGVALVLGTITGAVALSQVGDLEEGCPDKRCPPKQHDLLATHEALATTSTVAFSIAGAAAATGAIAWIIDATTGDDKTASVKLRWAGTGVAIEGTFQ
ncbi:MAG: hypothetical protein HOW73_50335 [Polyangiaceae bacterium]|nr:hypothetical protein [Polyangiaceae bacterium]